MLALLAVGVVALSWPYLTATQAACLALAWVGWCWLAARALVRQPQGRLLFRAPIAGADAAGRAWAWQGASTGAVDQPLDAPELVIDLQRVMLLRLAPAPGVPAWVWADAGQAPQDWLALRRALLWAAGQGAGADGRSGIVPRA